MSKVDAMRAMREARYAAAAKAGPSKPAPSPASSKVTSRVTSKASPLEPAPEGERCGHRNMGGKSCTRDTGHSEKNHRYS